MKIYLSGKISGLTEKEYTDKFIIAKAMVFSWYYPCKIYNPLDIKPLFGRKKKTKEVITENGIEYITHWTEIHKERYWCYMAADLYTLIFKCDSIYLLPNWNESRGSKIELFFALLTNKKILK